MKLENKEFGFDRFASEMASEDEKHFDYLVTVSVKTLVQRKVLDVSISLRIQIRTSVVL